MQWFYWRSWWQLRKFSTFLLTRSIYGDCSWYFLWTRSIYGDCSWYFYGHLQSGLYREVGQNAPLADCWWYCFYFVYFGFLRKCFVNCIEKNLVKKLYKNYVKNETNLMIYCNVMKKIQLVLKGLSKMKKNDKICSSCNFLWVVRLKLLNQPKSPKKYQPV